MSMDTKESIDKKIVSFEKRAKKVENRFTPTQMLRYKKKNRKGTKHFIQQYWMCTEGPNKGQGKWELLPVAEFGASDKEMTFKNVNGE